MIAKAGDNTIQIQLTNKDTVVMTINEGGKTVNFGVVDEKGKFVTKKYFANKNYKNVKSCVLLYNALEVVLANEKIQLYKSLGLNEQGLPLDTP